MFIVTCAIESFFFVFQRRCTRLGQAAGTVVAGFDIRRTVITRAAEKQKNLFEQPIINMAPLRGLGSVTTPEQNPVGAEGTPALQKSARTAG